ncbi:MAG: hypothetical protein QNK37_16185 [Acidobacteriota bacterium]|nr:hypothetical protein [Acidobacteriota bacterium]
MTQRLDILFSDTPPAKNAEFIQRTFINRELELRRAYALFHPEDLKDQIYAVHGFSRVGKSHLAIKLAQDFSNEFQLLYFYANANMRGTARDVLRTIFVQLRDFIFEQVSESEGEAADHLRFVKAYLDQINQLFLMPVARVAITRLQKEATKIKPSFRLKVPLINIGIGVDQSKGEDHSETIELNKPDAEGVVDIIQFLLESTAFITGRKFLLLVDDLDLLEESNGGLEERDRLINHLKQLAALPMVAVWVTSRQNYFIERQKEMFNFVNVPFLTSTELTDIYKARINNFHDGTSMFTAEVLKELAEGFQGIIGAFLYECFLFMGHHLGKDYPLNNSHLSEYLLAEVDKFHNNPETRSIFENITEAVRSGEREVEIKDVKRGHGLIYRVLIPKAYGQDVYEILPLFSKVIRNKAV